MKDDPIVVEVRRIRHEHAARFKYDLDLIAKDLKAQEQASGRSFVRLPPRRLAHHQARPPASTVQQALCGLTNSLLGSMRLALNQGSSRGVRPMGDSFVDIVGYQLEKIHTGVIAWLLDSERSPLTIHEQAMLLRKLAPDLLKEEIFTSTKAIREYSFGRSRRIDLVLEVVLKDQTKTCVLIECKTDSDVSLEQLEKSAQAFAEKNPKVRFLVIVLAVGAGQFTLMHQLQEIGRHGFHTIDVPRALDIFSSLSIAGTTPIYDDWIASLRAEHSRGNQIGKVLGGLDNPWNTRLLKTGYRIGFPVFYMFYDKLRAFLDKGPFQGWDIHSGRNNPVLQWQKGWISVGSENDAFSLYWEFNWDAFCLKAEIENQNAARWERWQKIRPAIVKLCKRCPIAGCQTSNRRGTWVTAYKWKFDFCREAPIDIARKTADILSHIHEHLKNVA